MNAIKEFICTELLYLKWKFKYKLTHKVMMLMILFIEPLHIINLGMADGNISRTYKMISIMVLHKQGFRYRELKISLLMLNNKIFVRILLLFIWMNTFSETWNGECRVSLWLQWTAWLAIHFQKWEIICYRFRSTDFLCIW